ncbi:hypothetical protein NPA07_03270 [Mycoplasmopsis caviae]|uniref:Uncharacterized protein n=1 Tax=Mycoplasmopsis caviae TaxID=55603 RepID=A0A3P8MDW9_9BACT|nr:hypothetical protein [Mycoplasmopsis caviae]UUD34817.1 hypothetical protein NPA07_03270 [Mycoplasmopsis caviae]VDR42330.1 Uncharacterised protein [Mycoplasmopsis caviae]
MISIDNNRAFLKYDPNKLKEEEIEYLREEIVKTEESQPFHFAVLDDTSPIVQEELENFIEQCNSEDIE